METRIKKSSRGCSEAVKGKPGTYVIYFSLGKDPVTGKYLRSPKRTVHCKSKNPRNWPAELARMLENYRNELECTDAPKKAVSLADYADEFHALRKGTMGSPEAYIREGYDIRHIRELFGDTVLQNLAPDDIRRAYARSRESGRFTGTELQRIHIKLNQVLRTAMENGYIARNPCSGIETPRRDGKTREALTLEEAQRLYRILTTSEMTPQIICTLILLIGGLRKGEALGLTWSDFHQDANCLSVNKQFSSDKTLRAPKTETSVRTVPIAHEFSQLLSRWRETQAEELNRLGIPQGDDTPIVHSVSVEKTASGNRARIVHMDGHNYSRWFRDFCVDNGYGTYRTVKKTFRDAEGKVHVRGTGYTGLVPHGLRHTQATLLIGEGTDVKTVQARLGHSDPKMTLSIYSHLVSENAVRAGNEVGTLLNPKDSRN